MWSRLQKAPLIIGIETVQNVLPSSAFMAINKIKFLTFTIIIKQEIIPLIIDRLRWVDIKATLVHAG